MSEQSARLAIQARINVRPVSKNAFKIVHPLIIEHEVIDLEIKGDEAAAIRGAIENGKIIQFPVFSIPKGEPGRRNLFIIGLALKHLVELLSCEFPGAKAEFQFSYAEPFCMEAARKMNHLVIDVL